MRYEVKKIFGDNFYQIVDNYNKRRVINTFYTEHIAKEFCDKLNVAATPFYGDMSGHPHKK